MGVRTEVRHLGRVVRDYRSGPRLKGQVRALRHLRLPHLRRRFRQPGQVWAVTVVRDELDVLPSTIRHLIDQGIDHILVADNLSSDGTRQWLTEAAAQDPRLHLALDANPAHDQSAKMTLLAHHAWRAGADWIIPFDADEFWFARGATLGTLLRATSANVVYADFIHMVPTTPAPKDLFGAEYVMDTQPAFPGKVAFRSHPLAVLAPGNHSVTRPGESRHGLAIAHAQYRSPSQIARKVRQGTQAARLTGEDLSWFSPHWAAASTLADAEIADIWSNISRGQPDERIQYKAYGPMLTLRPLTWRTWDPEGVVAKAQEPYRDQPRRGAH